MTFRTAAMASLLGIAVALGLGAPGRADDDSVPVIRFQDGSFDPPDLVVKARAPFRLRVVNANKDPIEFESFELNRERVVQPGQEIVVYLPALDPGTYPYFDDFHHDSGQGTITAR
jgi:cupredoxin-like protein